MTDDADHRRDYAFRADDPRAVTHDEAMYSGALSFCRRPYARRLAGADLAVIGVPLDTATTNRPGCRFGPRAIRAASAQLAWGRAWPSPFDPFERLAVVDWGDIAWDPGYPLEVPGRIEAAIAQVLGEGAATLLLGGDHFITYPSLRAHAARHGAGLSLIQFDAHSDTWGSDEAGRIDHGTMFRRAADDGIVDPARSIQVGLRTTNDDPMGFAIRDAIAVHEEGIAAATAHIREVVGANPAYVTFDIDCLDPAFAPGTGTPVSGGLSSAQALMTLAGLGALNFVGGDVVEVSPPYDHADITAIAASTVAQHYLGLLALRLGRAA